MGKEWQIHGPLYAQGARCAALLRALPDWFGIEAAIIHYREAVDTLPTFLALGAAERAVGFITLKQHSPAAAELYVMGVLPEMHRQGVGTALVARAEMYLREQNISYFQVKTLAPTHPDPGYARTRAFYEALGFCHLEIFPELWGAENPCLLLIKYLDNPKEQKP